MASAFFKLLLLCIISVGCFYAVSIKVRTLLPNALGIFPESSLLIFYNFSLYILLVVRKFRFGPHSKPNVMGIPLLFVGPRV